MPAKQPVVPKRAISHKSTTGRKRAVPGKVTEVTKRVGAPKATALGKRVVTVKKPVLPEQVRNQKTTAPSKRAVRDEKPKVSKRVVTSDTPVPPERAIRLESTEPAERRLWGQATDTDATPEAVGNVSGSNRPISVLRMLADTYTQTQRLRIQTTNRLGAVERGVDQHMEGFLPESMARLAKRLEAAESECAEAMDSAIEGHPAMKWLGQVAGVGPVLAAKMLAMIDIRRCQTVSALWRFAGYGVVVGTDGVGKRERPVKGEKLHYCIRLKTTLYLVGGSFLKLGDRSPYRKVYDESRAFYTVHRLDWTEGHRHAASMRRMIKRFLSHLWITWRTAEDLPIRAPYVAEQLGHTTISDPWDYVRPPKAPREPAKVTAS